MSSVSAHNSISPKKNIDEEHELKSKPSILLPDDDFQIRTMTRTNSESSLFSHISSVSEYYEKHKQNEDEEEEEEEVKTTKRGAIKKRAPVGKSKDVLLRHMDDNELSITKANEEAAENSKKGPGSSSLKRRKSDLSCSSGSSGASSAAAAKIKASIQKLPPTLGSNDQEIRVTRSKLKALIESPDVSSSSSGSTSAKAKTTRNSRKKLEIVEENEELLPNQTTTAKMSISNLRKHNAAMEKAETLESINEDEVEDSHANKRTTRSAARSPSPSASSIISASSIASTLTNASQTNVKRRGRAPKNAKKLEETPQHDKTLKDADQDIETASQIPSPTNSVVSVASVASSVTGRSTRRTTRRKTIEVETVKPEHTSPSIKASQESEVASPTNSVVSVSSIASSTTGRKYTRRNTRRNTIEIETIAKPDEELNVSPTNSVVSVASAASSVTTGRRTTRRNTIEIEKISVPEESSPTKSTLKRSNSGRNYNLRGKKGGKEALGEEILKAAATIEAASDVVEPKLTSRRAKSAKGAKTSEPVLNESPNLFKIDENEPVEASQSEKKDDLSKEKFNNIIQFVLNNN